MAEGEAAVYDWETLQDTGPNGAIRYYPHPHPNPNPDPDPNPNPDPDY